MSAGFDGQVFGSINRVTMVALALALAAGCANGDGQGFGSVSGTVTVTLDGADFTAPGGAAGTIEAITIGVGAMRLESVTPAPGGEQRTWAWLPVGAHWAPLAGEAQIPFGPYEVDRGEYTVVSAIVTRLDVTIMVGDEETSLEVLWPEGLAIEAAADLPVNRDRPPNIILSAELALDPSLLDGVDLNADDAQEQLAAGIRRAAVVNATWTRKHD